MPASPGWRIFGVDFTSSPRARKPITIARGFVLRSGFILEALDEHASWGSYEAWLTTPGPWIAGFDFPFGLPREAVLELGWPQTWPMLVRHCAAMGRVAFRQSLDRHRELRPAGHRYAHRAADLPARSHSPLKLVNPPVGLMFLEGVPRLLDARVSIPGLFAGEGNRVALEAYPAFTVRKICRVSYKSDATARQTPARRFARKAIVSRLASRENPFGFPLVGSRALMASLVNDASGDRLDAAICAMQAAWAYQRRKQNYGLPKHIDPLEGWIAMVPAPTGSQ